VKKSTNGKQIACDVHVSSNVISKMFERGK